MRPWTLAFGTLTIFLFVAACEDAPQRRKSKDDDDGSGGTAAGGSSSTTTGGGGSATSATSATTTSGAGGAFTSCFDACAFVYDCGLESDGAGQYCPGFTGSPSEKTTFVSGCSDTCEAQPLLLQFVDPNDCAGTIASLSSLSAEFAYVCDNGF